MGTYPVLPTYDVKSGKDLQEIIDAHPNELIGTVVPKKFGHTNLPFLPKVLSIRKALPLQLHPNKDLAAELHQKDPQNFTDPNHKPEIALALGKFEAFCGFKELEVIKPLLELEPLQKFLPTIKKPDFDDQSLKHVVKSMLEADEDTVEKTVKELEKLDDSAFGKETHIKPLIPRLADQYGKTDNGLLVALITMNFLTLKAGEGIYIPADGIHAYLSGDIIECMARSNNVLNTGFCPQAERNSVELFCSCLTFSPHSPEECMLRAQKYSGSKNGQSQVYKPPMSEFNMIVTELAKGETEVLAAVQGPSIALATKGNATLKAKGKSYDVKEGNVFFIGAGTEVELTSDDGLQMHTAYVE